MDQPINTNYCPKCGSANRPAAKFCNTCGGPLGLVLPPPPETIAPSVMPDDSVAVEQVQPSPEVTPTLQSAPVTGTDSVAAVEPLEPLAIGTKVFERYEILEVLESTNNLNRYRVRDARRCAMCNAVNLEDGQQFCNDCGAELSAAGGTCIFEESRAPQTRTDMPADGFVNGETQRLYIVHPDVPKPEEKKQFVHGVNLAFGCKSDRGLVRADTPDQDSIFAAVFSAVYDSVANPTIGLFFVADGVGGGDAGEVASKACAQTVVAQLMEHVITPILSGKELADDAVRDAIKSAILAANEQVLAIAKGKEADMGTTITLALVVNDNAYIANVGDSRTYLFANGTLKPLTQDHSLVAKFVASGEIQPEDVYTHPQRNYILRSLGMNSPLEVDVFPMEGGAIKLEPGARLLLCCDGLWEMVRDDELERALFSDATPQTLCEQLVQRANENGGDDNISVIVVSAGA